MTPVFTLYSRASILRAPGGDGRPVFLLTRESMQVASAFRDACRIRMGRRRAIVGVVSGASLRPASVLDGFFSEDVDAVAAASRALRDQASSGDADRSWGRIEEPTALKKGGKKTEPKGIYSEVIFGPRRVLKCACGALKGDAHRDETCATCGVLCGDPSLRDWRFGHVDVPVAIHPLMLSHVAAALAMSLDGVNAMLESEGNPTISGPHALADLLASSAAPQTLKDAAIVRRVPVPPPGDRRLVLNLTAAQAQPWIGPINEAWLALVRDAATLLQIEHAPLTTNEVQFALADVSRRLQRSLTRVVTLTRTPPAAHEHTRWIPPPPFEGDAPRPMTDVGDVPPRIDLMPATTNARAVFVDAFTLLVQRGNEVLHLDIDGKRKHRFRSPGRALRYLDAANGARAVFDGWLVNPWMWHIAYPEIDDEDPAAIAAAATLHQQNILTAAGSMAPLALFELASKKWATAWPDDLSCVGVHFDEGGLAGLVDRKTFHYLRSPWPGGAVLAWSRDGRYAWLGTDAHGGVVDVASGIPQIEPHVDEGREASVIESPTEAACAIGLTDELQWRFVHFDGALSDGKRVLANLGVFETAAFAPDCTWIATVRAGDVEVFDAAGHLSRKFRLP